MSQAVHLLSPGCGVPESRCLPCSGVSGRTAIVYSSSSQGGQRLQTHVKIRGLKCASIGSSFVCEARRNPDFPRQNKHGFSRGRNRQNEGKDIFENFEEDILSSKNGPFLSLSSTAKSQAGSNSAPGPREKEIVELFRKVQARLRERAAIKEDKKVETSQGQGKDNGTVDSLLKLLRKHSVEQVKRSSGGGRGKDFNLDQFQHSSQYNGGGSTRFSDLDPAPKDESQEANASSITANSTAARPRSVFQRRSPIPRVKYQPVSYDEDDVDTVSEKNQDQTGLETDSESELDSEPELDPKDELFFQDVGIAELSEDDPQTTNDEHGEEQQVVQHEDLSALKVPELRELAKSRGIKGFSKMKKSELMELLSGN
ncbi:hypothetical protein L6164_009980 [Bauhinia variegata]|uniref:Uncharacterized protein n=1 Tax=Bauhinia variegata TaxID=167791 RepID=A0ACB9PLV1_BAUVA|nr:hypothetical protein L6164_009980 [Bauhinia variegata]